MNLLLFWIAVFLLVYTYFLFPAFIYLRGLLVKKPYRVADVIPSVSLIIAAYNEAANIRQRIENLLALDYPQDQLEVLIASDGSTDETNAIVREYADRGIRLLALPRQGKVPTLNTAVTQATGDILVFSDANTEFAPDAVRALARPFADPSVGGVAGDQRYFKEKDAGGASEGEKSYWDFDRQMKLAQSRSGNVTSATGAIYAIRRSLYHPIPIGSVDDFMASVAVIAQGYRLVFAADAAAYEPVASDSRVEFGRKVRIITMGFRSVLEVRQLFNPMRYGFYAVQLFWHKVLRRLMALPLLVLLFVSPLLWNHGFLYQLATVGQIVFYGCALIGFIANDTRLGRFKIFGIPFFFCMVYAASLVSVIKTIRGHSVDRWETQRQSVDSGVTP